MWDLALDLESCDLIFGPHTDLLNAAGDVVTRQRMLVRCKVPRGTWVYDEDGTLGSRLYQISGRPSGQQINQAPTLVEEALEPMDDIHVGLVRAGVTDDNRLLLAVNYQPLDPFIGDNVTVAESNPEFDVTLTL